MIKLSIIVPIYNVEQYLRKCADSLLAQDIDNYEIILVDDGSTDESGAICDSYVSIDDRCIDNRCTIKVIHRENGGLSAARNSGIEIAQGEYVMFVDSDDYIESNVLGELMAKIERDNLDVLRYNYQNVNEQYEVFLPYRDAKRDVDYSETVVDGETFLNERLGQMCYAVMFIMKRELLNDCIFKEGIYFEDVEWTPRMILRAKRIASTSKVVYNYLWRTGSITQPSSLQKKKKVIDDKISLIYGFREQSKLVRDTTWFTWMSSFMTITILNALSGVSNNERKNYINELKRMHVFPLYTAKEKILSHRVKLMIANISPSLYCHMIKLLQH